MRQVTEEQKRKAEERRAAFGKLAQQVSKMSEEERAAFASRMPTVVTVEGRPLSVYNACLLALQDPTVTIVGGFRQWLKAGRVVRKGEHGLSLWVPSVKGDRDSEEGAEVRFLMGTVFDVSQTEELTQQAAA